MVLKREEPKRKVLERRCSEGRCSYLDFPIVYLGSNSCDACWVLLPKIFCCGSLATVFTNERDTHVLLQCQAVALLFVDVRIISTLLSHNEPKTFLRIEIL